MDPRYSRNPADHLGFLISWCRESHKNHRFKRWCHEELLSEAYLQTHRLLNTTYDPTKSSVVTFLKAFLWGAVHYAYWKNQGYRFTDTGVAPKVPLTDYPISEYIAVFTEQLPPEFPELTEEEWLIVRLRQDGYTMIQIADVIGLKSPQSVNNRLVRIKGKFLDGDPNAARRKARTTSNRSREECPPVSGERGDDLKSASDQII